MTAGVRASRLAAVVAPMRGVPRPMVIAVMIAVTAFGATGFMRTPHGFGVLSGAALPIEVAAHGLAVVPVVTRIVTIDGTRVVAAIMVLVVVHDMAHAVAVRIAPLSVVGAAGEIDDEQQAEHFFEHGESR